MLHEIATRSPEETRTRILAATRLLFAKKGRRGTTTREVAELAGVNEATLFRHFGSKDALIEACADHYCPAVQLGELIGALSGELEDDLRRLAILLSERMNQIRDLIVISLADEENGSAVGDAAWRTPTAIHRMLGEYMAKRVESGELQGEPLLLARFFMGMIFASVIGAKKFPDDLHTPEQRIDFQIGLFLNGARKKN